MIRRVCLIVAILGLLSSFLTAQSHSSSGRIVVSPNHRFLQYGVPNQQNAACAAFFANRYREKPNVFWVLG